MMLQIIDINRSANVIFPCSVFLGQNGAAYLICGMTQISSTEWKQVCRMHIKEVSKFVRFTSSVHVYPVLSEIYLVHFADAMK